MWRDGRGGDVTYKNKEKDRKQNDKTIPEYENRC